MKTCTSGIAALCIAVCTVGCQTDYGIYHKKAGGVRNFENAPGSPERKFGLPPEKEVSTQRERSSLVGKWRVLNETDGRFSMPYETLLKSSFTVVDYGHWSLEEWNFKADGSYVMNRCSESSGKTLDKSEEGGRWSYENGVLSIVTQYTCTPKPFGRVGRVEVNMSELRLVLAWHSDHEFTARYQDPNAYARRTNGHENATGWYDGEGCLRMKATCKASGSGESVSESVSRPLRFLSAKSLFK